jgi:ferredoxin
MAHHLATSGYQGLTQRVNRFPPGVVPSDVLLRIFALLFDDKDAALLAQLPLRPFTVRHAARAWRVPESAAAGLLDGFAERALLLDGVHRGRRLYVFAPPMAGFFEFAMMRVRNDVDQRALAELLHSYINEEDDFITRLFGGPTQLGRVLVYEPALPGRGRGAGAAARHEGDRAAAPRQPAGGNGRGAAGETDSAVSADGHGDSPSPDGLQVLDHELATEIVRQARHRAVGLCYCRHKMAHLGRACGAPQEMCLSLDFVADSLARHGHARAVDSSEAVALIEQAWELGLVQFAENVRTSPKFICNCCSCCCDAMLAARRLAFLRPVTSAGFLPVVDGARCSGCGVCLRACPVESLALVHAGDQGRPKVELARVDAETCLGCGLCVRSCSRGALTLTRRPERTLTPVNTAHRVVLQAIENGNLAELVFAQPGLATHRALAAVLGAVLRLPPLKQALASKQLQSRYVERILDRPRWGY